MPIAGRPPYVPDELALRRAANLRELRHARGLRQIDVVAAAANLRATEDRCLWVSTLSNLELGHASISLKMIDLLAVVYELPPATLLELLDTPRTE